jgi:hypothetical protein
MSIQHQTERPSRLGNGQWALAGERAERIDAAREARWLVVRDGEVWLTRTLARGQAEDIWLARGARVRLPAGSAWVAQGWPRARAELLLEPPPLSAARLSSLLRAWWRRASRAPRWG